MQILIAQMPELPNIPIPGTDFATEFGWLPWIVCLMIAVVLAIFSIVIVFWVPRLILSQQKERESLDKRNEQAEVRFEATLIRISTDFKDTSNQFLKDLSEERNLRRSDNQLLANAIDGLRKELAKSHDDEGQHRD